MYGTFVNEDWNLLREFKRSGEPEHLAELFHRYREPLYTRVLGLCHDSALAEDCVQEAFRRVIENVHNLENINPSNFWGWLATISRRIFLDESRRLQRERNALDQRGRPDNCPPLQESQALLSELRGELALLPPECRLCYVLFQVEGHSYKEIALITGFSYAQVKTRIQTARRHINRRFRPPVRCRRTGRIQ